MTWNYFKTNWFSIALVLLVLAAILRVSGRFSTPKCFTEKAAPRTKVTTLGIAAEPTHSPPSNKEVDQATAAAFVKRFAAVAISERKKFGIPASVLLATAFLNSNIGLSNAAQEANNFFSLPCSEDWEGLSAALDDRCVRKYETPWASWRDFSIYLSSQDWIGSLRKSAGKDWKKWSIGFNREDVSSISNFGKKMEEVIGYYHLYELDQQ